MSSGFRRVRSDRCCLAARSPQVLQGLIPRSGRDFLCTPPCMERARLVSGSQKLELIIETLILAKWETDQRPQDADWAKRACNFFPGPRNSIRYGKRLVCILHGTSPEQLLPSPRLQDRGRRIRLSRNRPIRPQCPPTLLFTAVSSFLSNLRVLPSASYLMVALDE
jgi:hypothetical protein